MRLSHQQILGILVGLLLVVGIQVAFYWVDFSSKFTPVSTDVLQKEMDSLRTLAGLPKKDTIFPFNPNFISDYKGFKLGLTPAEIDRLQAFRAQNRYVNSAEEFQQVTGVADSVLRRIAPFFKFPDWVKNRHFWADEAKNTPKHFPKQDINTATAEELMKIYGIGEGFSHRILKYREKLGGFTYINQVAEVYGLEKEVYERVAERFEVQTVPLIEKKDLNAINRYELSKIPYVKYGESNKIVGLRSELGTIHSFEELLQIEGFDKERIGRLQLYLYIQ
jgi:hypothetical protein